MVEIEYFKNKKNQLRLFMYFLLICGIWYHVITINLTISELYEWEQDFKSYKYLEPDLDTLYDYNTKVLDMNLSLAGHLNKIIWNIIGLMLIFVVIIYLWVIESIDTAKDDVKRNR